MSKDILFFYIITVSVTNSHGTGDVVIPVKSPIPFDADGVKKKMLKDYSTVSIEEVTEERHWLVAKFVREEDSLDNTEKSIPVH